MSAEKIISEWKNKIFKPLYWLEGDEPFFIDQVMQYAEHHLLSEAEAGFNLTVFYGRDAEWPAVVNACMRYPMFAERQVVLLKEAQLMKDIDKLENYITQPLASTVFVVSYKDKKVDARTRFAKTIKQKGELFTTKKLYDSQLPEWTSQLIAQQGLTITQKALALLVDHIGNDLSRIKNEIDKLTINLTGKKEITEQTIETFIGISKEFNVFELQDAVAKKDLAKCIRIIQYFDNNPKAAPIQLILPSLYGFFSKLAIYYGTSSRDEKTLASAMGVSPFFMKDYLVAARNYPYTDVEKSLLLLHQYNLRSIGVPYSGASDADLMKELVIKMIAN